MLTPEQIAIAKVLIVDDQKLHALFLEKILKDEGYKNIEILTDPSKVAEKVDDFRPDIIILELLMPQIDGFQIIEKVGEYRKRNYLPILTLSSDKSSHTRLRALQFGATDFISKPYEDIEIIFRISNMIEMRLIHLEMEKQNMILEAKVKQRTRELQETHLDIIRRLARAAEFRDNDTGMHIVRMSKYCATFAKALGLNEDECELILHATPLHDVGKIGIPDRILLKPGPLTNDEYEIMKTHTTIGAQLLTGSNSSIMQMAQEIALTHHEKWDGAGYPQGLKGKEIPLVGHICAVCDVFDALTSVRPYKKAWPVEVAINEMVKLKGAHFNPHLINRFVEILPEIKEIQQKHQD